MRRWALLPCHGQQLHHVRCRPVPAVHVRINVLRLRARVVLGRRRERLRFVRGRAVSIEHWVFHLPPLWCWNLYRFIGLIGMRQLLGRYLLSGLLSVHDMFGGILFWLGGLRLRELPWGNIFARVLECVRCLRVWKILQWKCEPVLHLVRGGLIEHGGLLELRPLRRGLLLRRLGECLQELRRGHGLAHRCGVRVNGLRLLRRWPVPGGRRGDGLLGVRRGAVFGAGRGELHGVRGGAVFGGRRVALRHLPRGHLLSSGRRRLLQLRRWDVPE